jgi:hypothetical protein
MRACTREGLWLRTLRIYLGPNAHYPVRTLKIIDLSLIVTKVLFTDFARIHVYEYRYQMLS